MTHHASLAALACVVLLLPGCDPSGPGSNGVGATPTVDEVELDVPSQAELDRAAADAINAENADEVFEDLEAEIDAGLSEEP